MNKKKINKKKMRRFIILPLIAIAIMLYSTSEIISYTFRIIELNKEQKKFSQELSELKAREQDLKIEIQKLQDPEYIARYARENYLYSKDGEYIIKIDDKQTSDDEANTSSNIKWYNYPLPIAMLLSVVFVLFRNNNIKKAKQKVLK
jgi:cell division protein DivIC